MGDMDPPLNTWFLGPTWVHNLNSISITSAIFAGLTIMTDTQTDRQTTLLHLQQQAASTYVMLRYSLIIFTNLITDVSHLSQLPAKTISHNQHRNTHLLELPRSRSPCMSRIELICVIQFCRTSSLGAWHTNCRSDDGVLSVRTNLNLSPPAFSSSAMLFTCNTKPATYTKYVTFTWTALLLVLDLLALQVH